MGGENGRERIWGEVEEFEKCRMKMGGKRMVLGVRFLSLGRYSLGDLYKSQNKAETPRSGGAAASPPLI